MQHRLRTTLLTGVGALVLAFGLVSGVSAAQPPIVAAVASSAPEASPEASTALPVLQYLLATGLIPAPAAHALDAILFEAGSRVAEGRPLERVVDGQGRSVPPGLASLVCRRVTAHPEVAPADLLERCRAWVSGSATTIGPAEACRRVESADDLSGTLEQRCREFFFGTGDTSHPAAACRRVGSAEEVSEDLVQRCREWLSSTDHRSGYEACRRLVGAEVSDETIVERCRELIASLDGGDRRERPVRPERTERTERPSVTDALRSTALEPTR